ncbi:hypothetical protein F2P81_004406 [Scophthalmus maximus]|uniref:Uncharacterized protein n=1 Tax=Scophthalmus maximus TaxID=52904 RepID=A0A6A4TDX4_SCOMX|nr:hypothetical protein F2P81_004406 [Scophthalmus maximus]
MYPTFALLQEHKKTVTHKTIDNVKPRNDTHIIAVTVRTEEEPAKFWYQLFRFRASFYLAEMVRTDILKKKKQLKM